MPLRIAPRPDDCRGPRLECGVLQCPAREDAGVLPIRSRTTVCDRGGLSPRGGEGPRTFSSCSSRLDTSRWIRSPDRTAMELTFTRKPPRFGTANGVQRRVSREHGRKCLRSYQRLRGRQDRAGQPVRHPELVVRRGQEAGDDQLPDLPSREGRPVLRADLRPREGLGVRLRQVPRDEVQGDDLRPLRRQGDALAASAASGWATSSWPRRSSTSGSSRRCPAAWAPCWT